MDIEDIQFAIEEVFDYENTKQEALKLRETYKY